MTASAAKSYREITQNIEMMHHQICLLGWGMWSKNKSIVTFHRISCCAMPVVLLGVGRPRFQDGIAVCKACGWSSCDFAAKIIVVCSADWFPTELHDVSAAAFITESREPSSHQAFSLCPTSMGNLIILNLVCACLCDFTPEHCFDCLTCRQLWTMDQVSYGHLCAESRQAPLLDVQK